MTDLEILTETKKILNDESKWTTGAFARNINNEIVDIRNEQSVKFCLLGAILKAKSSLGPFLPPIIRKLIKNKTQDEQITITEYNDASTYQQVIELLNEAIQLLSLEKS